MSSYQRRVKERNEAVKEVKELNLKIQSLVSQLRYNSYFVCKYDVLRGVEMVKNKLSGKIYIEEKTNEND